MTELMLFLVAAIFTAGCAQRLKRASIQKAQVADGFLGSGAYAVCAAATVGSICRRYGNRAEQMAAWKMYCEHEFNLQAVEVPLRGQ